MKTKVSVDKFVDTLADQKLKVSPLHYTDLDKTAKGKPRQHRTKSTVPSFNRMVMEEYHAEAHFIRDEEEIGHVEDLLTSIPGSQYVFSDPEWIPNGP